jgi:hypothetical protein
LRDRSIPALTAPYCWAAVCWYPTQAPSSGLVITGTQSRVAQMVDGSIHLHRTQATGRRSYHRTPATGRWRAAPAIRSGSGCLPVQWMRGFPWCRLQPGFGSRQCRHQQVFGFLHNHLTMGAGHLPVSRLQVHGLPQQHRPQARGTRVKRPRLIDLRKHHGKYLFIQPTL